MTHHFLYLNCNKTETMLVRSKSVLPNTPHFNIPIDNVTFPVSAQVKSFSVILDSTHFFDPHIKNLTKIAFFHLRNINSLHIRPSDSLFSFKKQLTTHLFRQAYMQYI